MQVLKICFFYLKEIKKGSIFAPAFGTLVRPFGAQAR